MFSKTINVMALYPGYIMNKNINVNHLESKISDNTGIILPAGGSKFTERT